MIHFNHLNRQYFPEITLSNSKCLRVLVFSSLGVQAGTDLRQWGPLSDVRPRSLATLESQCSQFPDGVSTSLHRQGLSLVSRGRRAL